MKNQHLRYVLLLNLAMLCISTSGALGRYIDLAPPLTIWYRSLFALLFLGIFCIWRKHPFKFDTKRHGATIFLTGVLMTAHWITYFYALKWANVAVAMLSLFIYPIITSLLEPIFLRTKLQFHNVLSSLILLIGIYFLVPTFDINNSMTQGLLMGVLSAFTYAIRNLILKTKIDNFNGSSLMFYQMLIMAIILLPIPFLLEHSFKMVYAELPYIIFLGLITTAIGHTLFLNSFKYFTVSTASIMSSMQPIYGILIAWFFLSEQPDTRSIIGGAIILLIVAINSIITPQNST